MAPGDLLAAHGAILSRGQPPRGEAGITARKSSEYNGEVPELPEVETARSLIADEALNRRIVGVDDADTFGPAALPRRAAGRADRAHAHRRPPARQDDVAGDFRDLRDGRLETAGPDPRNGPDLGVHLGMGGRIIVTSGAGEAAEGGGPVRRDAQPRKPEWNRFTLHFADGGALVLFDKRLLGRVRLNPGIDALGPDAAEVTPAEFRQLITKGSVAVKARLLDQSKIAGVGNLLADEALWKAKLSPSARTGSLSRTEADRLGRALQAALRSAIAHGGVHTGDVISARHPGGTCPRCGAEMRHGTVGGRSTWWCSREQVSP